MNFVARYGSLAARVVVITGLGLAVTACASVGDVDAARQEQVAKDPGALMRIAEAAEKSGDLAGAEAFYRRAGELQPDLSAAQIGDARSLAQQGNIDQALDTLRSAHIRDPASAEVTETLGRLLIVAKRPDEALAVFQDGLRNNPQSSSLLVGQGVALDVSGRHEEAQNAYNAALQINPDSAPARKNLALSKALMGKSQNTAKFPVSSNGLASSAEDKATSPKAM